MTPGLPSSWPTRFATPNRWVCAATTCIHIWKIQKREDRKEEREAVKIPQEKKQVRHFNDLIVWQKTRNIKNAVYEIIKTLPQSEKYNLEQQMRKAACSVTSNIAEGYGRYHFNENIQFCRQSRSSLYELQDHLITCMDQNHITDQKYNKLSKQINEAIKVLDGYFRFLLNSKHDQVTEESTEYVQRNDQNHLKSWIFQ